MKKALILLISICLFITSLPVTYATDAPYVLPSYGDVSNDGEISASDALAALQFSVKKIAFDKTTEFYANVDGDDKVTSQDALEILQFSVENIDTFSGCDDLDFNVDYEFDGKVSRDELCSYLSRMVTISRETSDYNTAHVRDFILNTGAKYIARAATCWSPSPADYNSFASQKAFIESVHEVDSDVVFEACIFECVSTEVNNIPVPSYVFEAFGLTPANRNFSYSDMLFSNGLYVNHWGENSSVPDITKLETRMFFYHRAVEYMKLGYEAFHMGQVTLMCSVDENYKYWTQYLDLVREYAKENTRRHFVFINAHTHGITDTNGYLMFDFHIYPSRIKAEASLSHPPQVDNPQKAHLEIGHLDSIYGKSLGGKTHSGWSCDSLPYIIEYDNYGYETANLNNSDPNSMFCWGKDEISWFANQPAWYRAYFLKYTYDFTMNHAPGDCFFSMPGQRISYIFNSDNQITSYQYFAYSTEKYAEGFDDEKYIKQIWS